MHTSDVRRSQCVQYISTLNCVWEKGSYHNTYVIVFVYGEHTYVHNISLFVNTQVKLGCVRIRGQNWFVCVKGLHGLSELLCMLCMGSVQGIG